MNFKEIINKNLCPLCLNNMTNNGIYNPRNEYICVNCSIVKIHNSYFNLDLYIYRTYDSDLELNIFYYKENQLVEFFVQKGFEILINNVGENVDSDIDPIEYWKALLILV